MSGGDRHLKFKTVCKTGQEDVDPVIQALKKKPHITVGVHSDTGMHLPGPDDPPSAKPLTVAEVAFWNEFGTKHIPERSFLRSAIEGKRRQHEAVFEKIVLSVYAGNMTIEQGLEVFGLHLETSVKKRIDEITDPANAPATIKGKGSSKPLVDTKQLQRSIFYKINEGDSNGG